MITEDGVSVLERYGSEAVLREYARRELRRQALLAAIHRKFPPENSPPTQRFHRDRSRWRSLRGPNQAGKTKAGARETAYRMLGVHPDYYVKAPPVHGRVVTYSFKQSRVVQRALFDMIPIEEIDPACLPDCEYGKMAETIRARGFKHGLLILVNGSTCEVYTAGQGTLAHSGDTLDFVWCDEPPKEGHYSELVARLLAMNGSLWLTYTPIGRPVEYLKKLCDSGKVADHNFKLTVEDCPFYTQSQIDEISAAYLPAEYEQRVNGAWDGVTTGRVFGAFNDKKHVFKQAPDFDYTLVLGGDHGEKSGKEVWFLIGVVQTEDQDFDLYVLAEYVSPGNTKPEQDAKGVAALLEGFGWDLWEVAYARADVNSAGKLGDGYSINALVERAFADLVRSKSSPFSVLTPAKGSGSIVAGCRKINHGFAEDRIYVHESCTSLLKTLRHWTGLNDDLKDAADGFRYIAVDFLNAPVDVAGEAVILR